VNSVGCRDWNVCLTKTIKRLPQGYVWRDVGVGADSLEKSSKVTCYCIESIYEVDHIFPMRHAHFLQTLDQSAQKIQMLDDHLVHKVVNLIHIKTRVTIGHNVI